MEGRGGVTIHPVAGWRERHVQRHSPAPTKSTGNCTVPSCSRAVRVSTGALLRFTKVGWPKCCGETMVLRDSDQPGAADTDYDLQPLRDQEG